MISNIWESLGVFICPQQVAATLHNRYDSESILHLVTLTSDWELWCIGDGRLQTDDA